jgi:hypothetical protein
MDEPSPKAVGRSLSSTKSCIVPWAAFSGFLAKHGDDIFDGDDIELVVGFEIDWDGVFWVEDDFVVLPQGHVFVMLDLATYGDDSTRNRWDFRRVGEGDSPFGFPLGFVFQDEDASADRFDRFKRGLFCHYTHRSKEFDRTGASQRVGPIDRSLRIG